MAIGVAIIGSGIFATEQHLPAVESTPVLKLKAIFSRSLVAATTLATVAKGDVDTYADDNNGKDYAALLARSDITAVIIALPINVQPVYIEAALAAGKHVLSEKPIANDIEAAEKLIHFYTAMKEKGTKATWAVAENFRFLAPFRFARQEIEKLGGVVGFRIKVFQHVKAGTKYFETEWRKIPSYQGGFLLDGGVHFTAGTRLLLGSVNRPVSLSAYTALIQPHLPPIDTVNSIWQTAKGISGTVQISFGTSLSGDEYTIACYDGSVSVSRDTVSVHTGEEKDGNVTKRVLLSSGSGVKAEVQAWAEGIEAGKENPLQSPAEALADLELLEAMIKSGEGDGVKVLLTRQEV
ncbi:hypothetical protein V499_04510 [Pseudogymnoascus sp. VKM F-103]|uniref:Gfo/Idh/MocA-like oxidoreductase N-terminal domain-containing protein n=1 Tax=Pseudogymnoascus verrucosus TaxID=342668 RepID=A0A1B8GI75_9PEZI|nr:uncharacterized protein VE01_05165 [Pseudogymnoascus verrucosus]KFY75511.1 hypothetical protein V499_04510 [Pseudogymnoascus sp. VKM F-103]OBT95540.1 hypothetical protein VE01_05165 [Pseudogymnoascus verrucosus]